MREKTAGASIPTGAGADLAITPGVLSGMKERYRTCSDTRQKKQAGKVAVAAARGSFFFGRIPGSDQRSSKQFNLTGIFPIIRFFKKISLREASGGERR